MLTMMHRAVIGLTAGAAVCSLLIVQTAKMNQPKPELPEFAVSAADSPLRLPLQLKGENAAPPEQETAYLLRLDGDLLSVYAEGSREAVEQYQLPAGWLPDYDRLLLEYGIRAGNRAELRRLLEDYVS